MTFLNPYLDEQQKVVERAQERYRLFMARQITGEEFYAEFSFETRQKMVRRYAWAIPNEAAIDRIAACAKEAPGGITEIGAGTGYWAWCLRQKGVLIAPYDLEPPAETWVDVNRGTERDALDARNLLLCWPLYDRPVARRALDWWMVGAKKGSFLFYVGEWGGCTGDDAFHHRLEWLQKEEFLSEPEVVDIPQWDMIHDKLYVMKVLNDG